MKPALFLLAALPFFSFECKNKTSAWLKGKVIRITCASTVVQVLDNKKIGDSSWADSMSTHQTYNNVFSVSNKCELPQTLKAGDEFWFTIDSISKTQCIVCMMYDAPPQSKFSVKNFSSEPCRQNQ